MTKFVSIHFLAFILCFWYIGAYIFQLYPSNLIAFAVIGLFAGNAFRNPAYGVVAAVFFAPLTLSFGHHLEAFFENSAPPYLPYAEIVLVSTLWGWVCRAILHECGLNQFSIPKKEKTDIEKIAIFAVGLWTFLTVLGVLPALYRNLTTSPSIPLELLAVKIAFAPVWGLADEFFPITMALRTLLLMAFVYYTMRLVSQKDIHRPLLLAFLSSISFVYLYAVAQFASGIGYSKWGNPAYYLQSTFHENEGFATFSLFAAMILLPYVFCSKRIRIKLLGYPVFFFTWSPSYCPTREPSCWWVPSVFLLSSVGV